MASGEDSTIHSSKGEEEEEEDVETTATDNSHSNSGSSKECSGPSSITDESNDITQSSSDVSSKCNSNQDVEGTEKTVDNTRISVKKKERVKIKVVPSRYKTSAAAARNSTHSSNSSGSSSSHTHSRSLNETPNAAPGSKRQVQRSKPIRSRQEEVLSSKSSLPSKPSISIARPAASQHSAHKQGSAAHASKSKTTKPGASKLNKTAAGGSKAVLHSTALNTTLMTDIASGKNNNSMLSSTLLSGVTPGGYKPNTARAALMELPDLSVIKPDGNNSGNRTVLSSVSEEGPQNECDVNTIIKVTPEMLEQEYLKYLQWAYVDVSSEKAFGIQLKEMQNQIAFLEHLESEKQEEVSELKRKTNIVTHHSRVCDAYDMQMKLLQTLTNDLPACEEAGTTLERELEKKLHQIKLENLYVPQDHTKYRDELSKALNTQLTLLQEFEKIIEPQEQQRNSTITLLSDLQNITDRVLRCDKEMQQAAGLAVEEASHKLGAKQMAITNEGDN